MYFLENVQRTLSLGHYVVIPAFFPHCADYVAVLNYANVPRGFVSGQRLCTDRSVRKHTRIRPAALLSSLCL